ncbi:MAG: N-acetylglucosamine-6-phosphate deacetylase [Actinomycetia bacterium]|nr:N-acetylglucosamine-6-phosphate deacetylase [Actinomycetes bacterium]
MTGIHIANGKDSAGVALSLSVINGVISDPNASLPTVDADGLTVAAGFIDIQVNGAYGHDFTEDPTSMWAVGSRLPEQGVTSFCPTIITSPPDRIAAAQKAIAIRPDGYVGAEPIGLHIEGPYLSQAKRGTHPKDLLVSAAPRQIDTSEIAIVTVAPEIQGVLSFIERLVAAGVVASLGHSAATSDETDQALGAGATLGTHLFNAMAPLTARDPGLAGVLMTDPRTHFGVIADGIHLAPEMLRLAWRSAPDRLILVTDAISATGMPEGAYDIGGVPVTVNQGAVRNATGSLAGSVLTMDRAVAVLMETTEASLKEATDAASLHPATALGRADLGTLSIGARGDVVLLDGTTVVATVVGGEIAFCKESDRLRGMPRDP